MSIKWNSFNGPAAADSHYRPISEEFPTLADLVRADYEIVGTCGNCSPYRRIVLTGVDAVARFGGHVQTGDLTGRMRCKDCGTQLSTGVQPRDHKNQYPRTTKSKAAWRQP